jgi:hypothetical protein
LEGTFCVVADNSPQNNALGVFYWAIEIRVNAAASSATITEATAKPPETADGSKCENCGRPPSDPKAFGKAGAMTNMLNLAMLICASVGAMAFGVLAAYAILRAGFALIHPRQRPVVVEPHAEMARIS